MQPLKRRIGDHIGPEAPEVQYYEFLLHPPHLRIRVLISGRSPANSI
jgi:hypothetical protein